VAAGLGGKGGLADRRTGGSRVAKSPAWRFLIPSNARDLLELFCELVLGSGAVSKVPRFARDEEFPLTTMP